MDIKSLNELNYNADKDMYNLYSPSFLKLPDGFYNFDYYIVSKEEEMRIDLIMKSIYGNNSYTPDLDVMLYLNDIDNPLNIKEGDILYYIDSSKFGDYRYYPIETDSEDTKIIEQLSIQNKTTRVDSNRENFIKNGFALPPVVSKQNKIPVTVQNGKIVAGGL